MPNDTMKSGRSRFVRFRSALRPVHGAILVAVIGVGVAFWTYSSHVKHTSDVIWLGNPDYKSMLSQYEVAPETVNKIDGDAFVEISNKNDIKLVMKNVEAAIEKNAATMLGLREKTIEDRRAFAHASALTIVPFLTSDVDDLVKSIRALGGQAPETDEQLSDLRSQWEHSAAIMKFVAAAPTRVEIVDGFIDTHNKKLRAGDALESGRMSLRMGMRMPSGYTSTTNITFPAVAAWDSTNHPLEAYETIVPVRLKIIKNGKVVLASIGVVMAKDPSTGLWQPALLVLRYDAKYIPALHGDEELKAYAKNYMPSSLSM